MDIVEVPLNSFRYRFRRLSWLEEARPVFPAGRLCLPTLFTTFLTSRSRPWKETALMASAGIQQPSHCATTEEAISMMTILQQSEATRRPLLNSAE